MVGAAVAVPVTLAGIALLDAALAGFRAATGRNGLIDKRRYYAVAMRRGLAIGAVVLTILATVLGAALAAAGQPADRYATFLRAGTGLLVVVGPFAAVVVVTLLGYAVLPRRPATFLMLLGLGPLTLARPYLTVAAGAAAAWWARDLVAAGAAALAVAAVLAVEPYAHRRWYTETV